MAQICKATKWLLPTVIWHTVPRSRILRELHMGFAVAAKSMPKYTKGAHLVKEHMLVTVVTAKSLEVYI